MVYHSLAPIYDDVMSHVKYNSWVSLINKIADRYFPSYIPLIFEMGGGTGVLAQRLAGHTFHYFGSDYSYSMCKEAHKKKFPFFCADARYPAVKPQTFDLAIFLYDGINYLPTLDDYRILFDSVYHCLKDQGCFLFDITTEKNSLTYFLDCVDAEDLRTASYIRHSYYDQEKKLQHNKFAISYRQSPESKPVRQVSEHHIQKIFSVEEICSAIPAHLFTIEGIWDNFTFNPYTAQSERIHFFLKKTKV